MPAIKKNRTFTIKEVSKLLNIPPGTIRQWEKDLNGLIVIPRTKQGARYYTESEINLLEKVKQMREKNVSKDMIRLLLEKYLHSNGNEEVLNYPSLPMIAEQQPPQAPSYTLEEFQELLDNYKKEIIQAVREEVTFQQTHIVESVKKELSTTSLHTIKELSKSIQRSNNKRKGEIESLSETIKDIADTTVDELEDIHHQIWRSSQNTVENINRKVSETIRQHNKDNKLAVKKASHTIQEAAGEIEEIKKAVKEEREQIYNTLTQIKYSMEEIEQREMAFQDFLHNFREAAPTKGKKRRWKFWF